MQGYLVEVRYQWDGVWTPYRAYFSKVKAIREMDLLKKNLNYEYRLKPLVIDTRREGMEDATTCPLQG